LSLDLQHIHNCKSVTLVRSNLTACMLHNTEGSNTPDRYQLTCSDSAAKAVVKRSSGQSAGRTFQL